MQIKLISLVSTALLLTAGLANPVPAADGPLTDLNMDQVSELISLQSSTGLDARALDKRLGPCLKCDTKLHIYTCCYLVGQQFLCFTYKCVSQ